MRTATELKTSIVKTGESPKEKNQRDLSTIRKKNSSNLWKQIINFRHIYLLMLPGLLFLCIFKFAPLTGLIIAFQDYNPFAGMLKSPFVGFQNFADLFKSKDFFFMLRNTLVINCFAIIFYFPLPIILSIMMNEVRHTSFKRMMQSMVYLPHFLSWVVVASMTFFLLSIDSGLVNKVLHKIGVEQVSFLTNPNLTWIIITLQTIWREMGWGTILFLAAITGINPQRYEAAIIDGASRMQQIIYITIPGIAPTIITMLILRFGHIADVSLEQILMIQNPLIMDVAQVFDTYAFTQGVQKGLTSVGVAVGMFKSVVNLALVLSANYVIKKTGQGGIF